MHALHPCTDLWLWMRWIFGVGIVWWLPGYLVADRAFRTWPLVFRGYLAVAIGLVWTTGVGHLASLLGLVFPMSAFAVLGVVTALALRFGTKMTALTAWWASSLRGRAWWVLGGCFLLAVGHLVGFRNMTAPPHVDDASNHAFFVWRISQVGSLSPSLIFGPGAPIPDVPYLAGWHFAAAVAGGVAGLAPYVTTWFAALTATILLPLALACLWWRWGVAWPPLVLAGLWLGTDSFLPGTMYSWGGFGQLVGFFLLPAAVILGSVCIPVKVVTDSG